MNHFPPTSSERSALTVGVDLAKGAANTAICTIRWEDGGAVVDALVVGAEDHAVLAAARAPNVTAIALDAPFGWPVAMVSAVSSWRLGGRWAKPSDKAFRLRRTDVVTAERTREAASRYRPMGVEPAVPLSVSADKIAMVAWRCCGLLDELTQEGASIVTDSLGAPFPADGSRRVVEAYPAAALAVWGVPRAGYKGEGSAAEQVRERILAAVERSSMGPRLRWASDLRERCVKTDHALDAFVCALVARAATLGLVDAVPSEDVTSARTEGWIAVPDQASLARLGGGAAEPP